MWKPALEDVFPMDATAIGVRSESDPLELTKGAYCNFGDGHLKTGRAGIMINTKNGAITSSRTR